MELNESIRSRAYRCLRPLSNFQSAAQAAANLPDEVQARILPNEELLGIYVNSDADPLANLVFTTRGVYHFAERWTWIEYTEMNSSRVFRNEYFNVETADTLLLQLKDGQEVKLVIAGTVTKIISGHERRFPDLYPVLEFLDRVIGRTKLNQSP